MTIFSIFRDIMNIAVFSMFLHFSLFILVFTHFSESKDAGSITENAPVEKNRVFFAKENTLARPRHRVLRLIDGSGEAREEQDEGSVDIPSGSSGEGSSSFETIEQSGSVKQRPDESVGVEISGSGSGYGNANGKDTIEEKLKELVEEEELTTTETTGRASEKISSSTGEMESLTRTTPYARVHGSTGIPTAETFTAQVGNANDKQFPTTGITKIDELTDAVTLEAATTNEERPTTPTVAQKTTSFLDVLQEIRRDLDELWQWKEEHDWKMHEAARYIGEVFKQESGQDYKRGRANKKRHLGNERNRVKRSNDEKESGLSKEILRKIERNFPCRHPQTMVLIKGGSSFFNQQECMQCRCHLGKLSCEKDLEKCYPRACHLLDGEVVPNLAIHNDGCNNCLCHFGNLTCTRLRCPEAGHHYTNYKANGLTNVDPEDHMSQEAATRNPDACLECDHLPGPAVCGKRQWKTFPSLCHAIFCGQNQDEEIEEQSCESLDPCASSPCGEDEECIPHKQTPCLAGDKTQLLCQQYKCISTNLKCPNSPTTAKTCGVDGNSYSNECEILSKGVQLAYNGPCKMKCNSEVCGIESRTFASHCHAKEVNAYVDYLGHCEYHFATALIQDSFIGESSFQDKRCDLVYEHGRCAPTKCAKAVLPPGACCPLCGAALVVSLNLNRFNKNTAPLRLDQMHAFVTNLQEKTPRQLCKVSVDLTYSMDVLIVVQPYKINQLEPCRGVAAGIVDEINFERDDEQTGILSVIGAATMVEETAVEIIEEEEEDLD